MTGHDIIVIGASAGGVEALKLLLRDLPDDLPASIFVVLHLAEGGPSLLDSILAKVTKLVVQSATDKMRIRRRNIYIAPPDHHLLVERNRVRVIRGPKENRHRPAIDPLFRSAAWAYGPRVIGVILSGTLDDGTAGLWAIKSSGGVAMVQDPAEALYPSMPQSALRHVEVDYTLTLSGLAKQIDASARQPVNGNGRHAVPDKIEAETNFLFEQADFDAMNQIGKPSSLTCPACGGSLWELQDGDFVRYRCHTGHAFTAESLVSEQSEVIESALFSAIRSMEEKAATLRNIANRFSSKLKKQQEDYLSRAAKLDESATVIRELLAGRSGAA
jgi:two-component system chemotaxis response regulator CheB